jgi:hypothetical protein
MNWFDEAVARHQREQRMRQQHDASSQSTSHTSRTDDPQQLRQEEVAAFDPLVRRVLTEYAERVFGKSFVQKRFLVRLERPGHRPGARSKSTSALQEAAGDNSKCWTWHWHLDSLVRGKPGLELHPTFSPINLIQGFVLLSGQHRLEISSPDEEAIKEGLVSLFLR